MLSGEADNPCFLGLEMTKNVSFFWLSNKMFRNFIGKMMKLFLHCGKISKTTYHVLTQKRQKMESSTLQDSDDEYSAFDGCLLTLLHQALHSGLCSYLSHLKLATAFVGGTVSISMLEMIKVRFREIHL